MAKKEIERYSYASEPVDMTASPTVHTSIELPKVETQRRGKHQLPSANSIGADASTPSELCGAIRQCSDWMTYCDKVLEQLDRKPPVMAMASSSLFSGLFVAYVLNVPSLSGGAPNPVENVYIALMIFLVMVFLLGLGAAVWEKVAKKPVRSIREKDIQTFRHQRVAYELRRGELESRLPSTEDTQRQQLDDAQRRQIEAAPQQQPEQQETLMDRLRSRRPR